MKSKIYEVAVIGNGLLGSAATEKLSQGGRSVIAFGCDYGYQSQYFSSHEDDSRLVRLSHSNHYWDDMTVKNVGLIKSLENKLSVNIYKNIGILSARENIDCRSLNNVNNNFLDMSARDFNNVIVDDFGGYINPLEYIDALNRSAIHQSATIVQCPIVKIIKNKLFYQLYDDSGVCYLAKTIVDARGVNTPNIDESSAYVVGKILLFFEEKIKPNNVDPRVFHFKLEGNDFFNEIYGLYRYKQLNGCFKTKVGVGELSHIILDSQKDIAEWYRGNYNDYCYREPLFDVIDQFFLGNKSNVYIKPCSFSVTKSGQVECIKEDNYVSIYGCNGMSAKCAQAIANHYLDDIL